MSGIVEDLRYALRHVRSNPRLLALIVVVLGIGVGATATMFSLIEAAAHLPIREQDKIALIFSVNPSRSLDRTPISAGDFADIKARLSAIEDAAAISEESVDIAGSAEPARIPIQRVTTNFFSLLGVEPELGRTFREQDAAGEPVVVLSHSTWQTRFGADPAILGKTVRIDGAAHRIIGVMNSQFQYLSYPTALWLSMKYPSTTADRASRDYMVAARLRSVSDRPQLEAQLSLLAQQLAVEHSDADAGWQFNVTRAIPLRRDETFVIGIVVLLPFFVLAIACANIAIIFLARSASRRREIAVRVALGASRSRILRLLLIESAVYASAGGLAGLLAAAWGIALMRAGSPFWANAKLDLRVLAATFLIALACGLAFGLAPGLHVRRIAVGETLKRTALNSTLDRKGHRLRTALLISQVAVATLLLLLSGLVLRSVIVLRTMNVGFRVGGVQVFHLAIRDYRRSGLEGAAEGHLAILESLRRISGVIAAGAGTRAPTEGGRNNPTQQIEIEGKIYPGNERDWAQDLTVTTGYFEALGAPVLRGRPFDESDTASSTPVAVISRTMANRYWEGRDPVGMKFRLTDAGPNAPWITIAGVVGDVRNDDAGAPPLPTVYYPLTQQPQRALTYIIQTSGGSSIPPAAIRTAVANIEPDLPVYGFKTMQQLLNDDLAGAYFTTGFLAAMGIIALSLSCLGIFGVISHIASERRPEIAIRISLGAMPGAIVRTFVWRALRFACAGAFVGGLAAAGAFRLIRSTLSKDVSMFDPLTLGAVAALLILSAAAASYLPLRRAARLDPMTVLRSE